jgi:hypothetical protein
MIDIARPEQARKRIFRCSPSSRALLLCVSKFKEFFISAYLFALSDLFLWPAFLRQSGFGRVYFPRRSARVKIELIDQFAPPEGRVCGLMIF